MSKNMEIVHNLGLPYMGSKRKLAKRIVLYILDQNPRVKYLYDLFGGGGSISFEAVQYPNFKRIFYNDINAGIVELVKKILFQKDNSEKDFYQFVDRETFQRHKNDNDWFGGLCKVVWSFGNNQKNYLYGKDREKLKEIMHKIVVDNNADAVLNLKKLGINIQLECNSVSGESLNDKRLRIIHQIKCQKNDIKNKKEAFMYLEHLERLQHLIQINLLCKLNKLYTYRDKFEILNKSYNEVEIKTPVNETVVYLDPPYAKTSKYQYEIDYDKLYKYIKESPYTVYTSSYDTSLRCVKEYKHRSTFSRTNNSKMTIEKLFINR